MIKFIRNIKILHKGYTRFNLFLIIVLFTTYAFSNPPVTTKNQENLELEVEFYAIPSPDEILEYIHRNEIEYTPSLMADLAKRDQYVTYKERLVMYGVYMANMAYAASFDQTNTALSYFNVIEETGRNMNIFPPEIEQLGERLMQNINNMDSVNYIYDELYLLTISNLHETDRFGEYALITAGGFIESIYLALNSRGSKIKENEFMMRVWDQKMILNQLNQMFERYLSPSVKNQITLEFVELNEAYNQFAGADNPATSEREENGRIVIGTSNADRTISNPIDRIHKEVNKLRLKWVQ
ncbi:hypothetical protein [Alkalitalea saponilacus]|uniref:Uncharacterized protein n=1 Tax=Alkalitalea saponilacus TaxID=889453 RepID=A0A1T5F8P5_9BACT|nr:hypothetical protein [Alkalitalea saponilacus]ASB50128.1 hypothetical protein CDL62_13765 [Alkalitalea saponilacus]SKB92533.1 hypothetical protein SAMN03080601_01529 [Alkalitalea saponilacus]